MGGEERAGIEGKGGRGDEERKGIGGMNCWAREM